MLETCSFAPPLCGRQSSSSLCHAHVCLALLSLLLLLVLVLSMMPLHAVVLTTLWWSRIVHWVWRNCSNTSMSPPRPNEMPHGSNWTELSHSDPSQCNVGHMGWSFEGRKDTSSSALLQHPLAWYSRSHITQSAMEERAKVPSSNTAV